MPRGSKRKRDALRDEQNMKKQVRFTKDDEMPAKPEYVHNAAHFPLTNR